MRADKGLDRLPAILENIAEAQRQRLSLSFAGRGDCGAAVEAASRVVHVTKGPSSKFLGDIEIAREIARSDLLLAPYPRVSASGSVVMALSCELRVVAYDTGALAEVVAPSGLVPLGEEKAFAETIVAALDSDRGGGVQTLAQWRDASLSSVVAHRSRQRRSSLDARVSGSGSRTRRDHPVMPREGRQPPAQDEQGHGAGHLGVAIGADFPPDIDRLALRQDDRHHSLAKILGNGLARGAEILQRLDLALAAPQAPGRIGRRDFPRRSSARRLSSPARKKSCAVSFAGLRERQVFRAVVAVELVAIAQPRQRPVVKPHADEIHRDGLELVAARETSTTSGKRLDFRGVAGLEQALDMGPSGGGSRSA